MHDHGHVKKIMDECISKLGEHCDSVIIMVTAPCDDCGGAESICFGHGNPMAQLGLAHEFIARNNAIRVAEAIFLAQDPEEDEE